jgi:hypothetical protein
MVSTFSTGGTRMKCKLIIPILFLLWLHGWWNPAKAFSQNSEMPPAAASPGEPTLVQAAVCEAIKDQDPLNQGVVFSVSIGKLLCFTSFDPVPKETSIYHNWYSKDSLSKTAKLSLRPPRWSAYSRIELREADKGPWRVEIATGKGRILRVLRFSITD